MNLLEERIRKEGKALSESVLKVDSFINHQVDPEFMDLLGKDFAEHFGDYETDAVHIRNENLKVDYEICMDERSYHDIYHR